MPIFFYNKLAKANKNKGKNFYKNNIHKLPSNLQRQGIKQQGIVNYQIQLIFLLRQEEQEILESEKQEIEDHQQFRLQEQPSILKNGKLKEFQLYGLNWLISLYSIGINGILADEMGLGKTIEAIALIAFLKQYKHIHGPHLIIAPKSTLGNWVKEFKRWLPCCRVLKLIAVKEEREAILKHHFKEGQFDVCLTSYEGLNICKNHIYKFQWKYTIIDEAHRIKNEESLLSTNVRKIQSNNRLLLTGTPLQNNLHELWSLLNYLLPDIFESSDLFDSWFQQSEFKGNQDQSMYTEEKQYQEQKNLEMVQLLQKILKPFMLRRNKKEVDKSIPAKKEVYLYVGLTEKQVEIYKNLLTTRNALNNESDTKTYYLNIIMQLRKVCAHPYLFDGVEDHSLPILGDHIITTSGKMIIMDKLLQRLFELNQEFNDNSQEQQKEEIQKNQAGFTIRRLKHQILIFSQMTRVLDILEDYCHYRQYQYCRIDGDTDMVSRDNQIEQFMQPNSLKFIFLLSTRAGGLGINLAAADTVILYDSDWNPQVDLQAQDRAHRIGQEKQVNIFRLITENTIEEKIIERQIVKLKWDSLVIQKGQVQQKSKQFAKDQLKEMIQYGANEIFKSTGGTITEEDIEKLLSRGELKAQEQLKEIEGYFSKFNNVLDLSQGAFNIYDFQNINYERKKKEDERAIKEMQQQIYLSEENNADALARTRREKKTLNSNVDSYSDQLALQIAEKKMQIRAKIPKFQDYQLYFKRERLIELCEQEVEYKATIQAKKIIYKNTPQTMIPQEDQEILNANDHFECGLSIEEVAEKNKLMESGFPSWNKQEFIYFLQGCERFGRENYKEIAKHVKTKDEQQIKTYAKCFFERVSEVMPDSCDRILKNIEKGEQNIQKRIDDQLLINVKCKNYNNWRDEFSFNTSYYSKFKDKNYTFLHDKFLVYFASVEGQDQLTKIKFDFKKENLFRFDHFIKSRNELELSKRLKKIIKVLEKEQEEEEQKKAQKNSSDQRKKIEIVQLSNEKEEINKKMRQPTLEEIYQKKKQIKIN